ncbi:hypothetical protein [Acetobacter sp. AAB5]|uniref:hypothetical protein n=1 Tax=Acetobacter sp. AAB5 TaxID=3418370 RepID=UPI003CED632E
MEKNMNTMPFPARAAAVIFCLPVAGAVLAGVLGLSFPVALGPIICAAALGAWLGIKLQPHTAAPTPAAAPPAPAPTTDSKLRHDIRGIVSPAMLAAEQLDTYSDPAVQKAAKTINDSLDRLTARLKQRPQS